MARKVAARVQGSLKKGTGSNDVGGSNIHTSSNNNTVIRLPEIDAHLDQVEAMSKTLAKQYRQKKRAEKEKPEAPC